MARNKLIQFALQSWYRARQDKAMIEQFSGPELTDADELRSWRNIRRAAVLRIMRPADDD
jgi:hypothetical protein